MTRRWNEFWFAEKSSESMGVLRIFYGLAAVCKCTGLWGLHKSSWGIALPAHRKAPISEMGDLYRDPVPGFDWIPSVPPSTWDTWETFGMIFALLWTVGFLTRVSGWMLFLYFTVPMLHSRFDYWHHSANFMMFLAIFTVAPTADHYSLDRFVFGDKDIPKTRPVWALRLLQVLLTWVYASTLFGKLNLAWFDGTILRVMDDGGMLKGPWKATILSIIDTHTLSLFTLFSQAAFIALIWTRYRRAAWFLGASLHIGIDLLMNVTTFTMQMIALYIAFIDPQSKRTRVFFDGADDSARQRARFGLLFDWFRRIDWVDLRSSGELRPTERSDFLARGGLTVLKPDGTIVRGLSATHAIFELLPLTFLPSFLLTPVAWVAERWSPTPTTKVAQ